MSLGHLLSLLNSVRILFRKFQRDAERKWKWWESLLESYLESFKVFLRRTWILYHAEVRILFRKFQSAPVPVKQPEPMALESYLESFKVICGCSKMHGIVS